MGWAITAWSYFSPGIGVNPATGLHMANLNFPCFTDWDLASYTMSVIYAYKLGLITSGGTCADTQSSNWGFNCRIQDILNFLMGRPLMSSDSPYDFYCNGSSSCQSGGGYQFCDLTSNGGGGTSASDTGRLLGALSILETVDSAYDTTINSILMRSVNTYDQFASTCCNGADYYAYLMGEGYSAFDYSGCNPCGVFSAVNNYSGPTCSLNSETIPLINTLAEPLNLEILLGQAHSTSSGFVTDAQDVYTVQMNEQNMNGSLIAWTEGVYPSYPPYYMSYVYEWVLYNNNGNCLSWSIAPPSNPDPVLAFTKAAFSYLAIYGSNSYTDALVSAVSALASSTCSTSACGFGEGTLRNGQSAESLWPGSGASSAGFYSDKTQEQVLESAYYAISHTTPTTPAFGSISSSVASAAAGSVWVVLPDFNAGETGSMHTSAAKCGGRVPALATDVYAATYLFGALTNPQQNEVLDTNSAYISQSSASCGEPLTSTSQALVGVAGPPVSEVVNYYESTGQTPLYFSYNSQAQECIGVRATGAQVVCVLPTATNDYFLMEAFTDTAGREVFIIYGLQWGGTLAGFQYAVNFVLKNPSNYPDSWYVYQWQDATSGVSQNSIPDPGDTYTPIASGP